jgi:hypothetical protein
MVLSARFRRINKSFSDAQGGDPKTLQEMLFEKIFTCLVVRILLIQKTDENVGIENDHAGHSDRSSARALRG